MARLHVLGLALALLPALAATGTVIRLPIKRAARVPKLSRGAKQELGTHLDITTRLGAFAIGGRQDVRLENRYNVAYYGEIQVGSPGQTVTVIFDTGSSDLWVSSVPSSVTGGNFFNSSMSASHEDTNEAFEISYGSGDISGIFCRDVITIGQLMLENFTFAEVEDTAHLKGWNGEHFNGILGLGFAALARTKGGTFMEALVESGQLESPVFGFFLGDNGPGQLVLGGYAPEHVSGTFKWVNVTRESWWAVDLDSVKLGSQLSLSASAIAIVDSGTSLIAGPRREVLALTAMMRAEYLEWLDSYAINCDADIPDVTFVLSGESFTLSVKDLVIDQVDMFCILGIQSIELGTPVWILGDVFMRKYYVQFDWGQKRLGIALSAGTPNLV